MKRFDLLFAAVALSIFPAQFCFADFIWEGNGDGVSIYQEANWLDTSTGMAPAANSLNPNLEVNTDLFASSGTPGGPGGGSAHLRLGTGSLTVSGDAVWRMSRSGAAGIRTDANNAGNNYAQLTVTDTAQLLAQFFSKLQVTLGGSANVTLYGGGNPVNNSTFDIVSGSPTLTFLAETPTDFETEHLSKITVFGAPAELGVNLLVDSDGGAGSVVTFVPEPSTYALLAIGLFGLALLHWQRRKAG